MGRRTQKRNVEKTPENFYFGEPKDNNTVILTIGEFEALRLKHYQNLNQKKAAQKMGVSQPTFSRILDKAHQTLTQALIEGKKILVHGGNVDFQ
jgi:predicted DNA-binding protein (UPF0251 family)